MKNIKILIKIGLLIYQKEGLKGVKNRIIRVSKGEKLNPEKFHNIIEPEYIERINKFSSKFYIYFNFIKINIKSLLLFFNIHIIYNGFIFKKSNNRFWGSIDSGNILLSGVLRRDIRLRGWIVDVKEKVFPTLEISLNGVIQNYKKIKRADVVQALDISLNSDIFGYDSQLKLSFGLNILKIILVCNGNRLIYAQAVIFNFYDLKPQTIPKKILQYNKVGSIIENIKRRNNYSVMRHINQLNKTDEAPFFHIILYGNFNINNFNSTINSLNSQFYKNFKIYNSHGSLSNSDGFSFIAHQIELSPEGVLDGYSIYIPYGNKLSEDCLYNFACAIVSDPLVDMVYADQDFALNNNSEHIPFYKPDWSPDYLETFNYIGFLACFRNSLLFMDKSYINYYDFVLKFTELTKNIFHIKNILGTSVYSHIGDSISDLKALSSRVSRTGRNGYAYKDPKYDGCFHIDSALPSNPTVSIIIPTAGQVASYSNREIDLVCNVIDHLRNNTSYANIEIVIVHGGELSPKQLKFLKQKNCISKIHKNEKFSFSKSCNLGAASATGEFLIFLNDDIEVIEDNWIEEMLKHFQKPHVGIVGAKLLYPDGKLQHAGVVHNYGCPDHIRDGFLGDESGYFFSTCGARNYLAVTGACFGLRKNLFDKIGGFSEELPVNFNDTDLCLKVISAGYTVVYSPKVILTHMTSQSRALSSTDIISANAQELNWYQTRWAVETTYDPYYNAKFLDVARPTFTPTYNQDVL